MQLIDIFQNVKTIQTVNLAERHDRKGSQWLNFTRVGLFDINGNEQTPSFYWSRFILRFYYMSEKVTRNVTVNVAINAEAVMGYMLTNLNSLMLTCKRWICI